MNDNFYIDDLIDALSKEITMERYSPLFPLREELLGFMRERMAVRRDDIDDGMISELGEKYGDDIAALFARYIHLYDFSKAKLRDIKPFIGTESYAPLADLLRLPGVRLLRAELYHNSGVSLEMLAEKTTAEIQSMVREYIEREGRGEIVPLTKEVNCHRAVARMILHIENE